MSVAYDTILAPITRGATEAFPNSILNKSSHGVSCSIATTMPQRTSSNGLVSLKQLSQTSFTARSAAAASGHRGLAATDCTARRRTQTCIAQAEQSFASFGQDAVSGATHLVLLRKVRLESVEEFTRPSAVATQAIGPDLFPQLRHRSQET